MRVACVLESFPPIVGGTEARSKSLLTRLPPSWEVDVYTPRFGDSPQEETDRGIRIIRLGELNPTNYFKANGRPMFDSLRFAANARKALSKNENRYEVIFYSEWNLVHFLLSHRVAGVPTVADWCEVLARKLRGVQGRLETYLESYLARNASIATTISRAITLELAAVHGVPMGKIHTVENGVEEEELSYTPPDKKEQKVLYAGRLVAHKRCELLIDAMKIVNSARKIELVIVGDGNSEYVRRLKERAPSWVRFTGWLPQAELNEEFAKARIFALTSEREGSSLSGLSAMAKGTPVITVNSPLNMARQDPVEHGRNGLVVDATPESLALAILELANNEATYSSLSRGAYETVERRTWGASAKKLEAALVEASNSEARRA